MKDECGEIFVYFTNDDVCKKLNCSRNKATRLFRELESYGLIYRRKQRLGKADIIYINTDFEHSKTENDNTKNDDSVVAKIATTDSTKLRESILIIVILKRVISIHLSTMMRSKKI